MNRLTFSITEKALLVAAISVMLLPINAAAHNEVLTQRVTPVRADAHAPIGVMGDHRHKAGEWMFSYRVMTMEMDGNLQGESAVSADRIATTIANPFAGPATVRVVPDKMTTTMHMLGMMYAPSDRVTLMAMVNYLDREMDLITYAGMAGAQRLGKFTTATAGLGDTKIAALWGLYSGARHNWHINLGLSLPTGSIDEEDTVLAPTGMRMAMRLPYGMQLGSGTYDLEPGITYAGKVGRWGWGGQYMASLRLGENQENYSLGDLHKVTLWGNFSLQDSLSISARMTYQRQGEIKGKDAEITAPVTTANPDNYGGELLNLAIGANLAGQFGGLRGHRLAIEYQLPVYQDVNGVQMEMTSMLTIGYQYAF